MKNVIVNKAADLPRILKQLKELERNMPTVIGNEAVNFFKDRFRKQQWLDSSTEAWAPRSTRSETRKRDKKAGRALLVDSGRLRRSIRILAKLAGYVKVGTDVPYAQMHNEGLTVNKTVTVKQHQRKNRKAKGMATVKSHPRRMNLTMKRRQFMGKSQWLENRIRKIVSLLILKAIK